MQKIKNYFASCLLLLTVLVTNPAWAHVTLQKSVPAADSQVELPLVQLQFIFNKPVRLFKVWLINSEQQEIALDLSKQKQFAAEQKIILPELIPDQYQVVWIVVGKDGHKIEGQWLFQLNAPDKGILSEQPVAQSEPQTEPQPMQVPKAAIDTAEDE